MSGLRRNAVPGERRARSIQESDMSPLPRRTAGGSHSEKGCVPFTPPSVAPGHYSGSDLLSMFSNKPRPVATNTTKI